MDELLASIRVELLTGFNCCKNEHDLTKHFADFVYALGHNYRETLLAAMEAGRLKKDEFEDQMKGSPAIFELIHCAFDLAFRNVAPANAERLVTKWWDARAKALSAAFEEDLKRREDFVNKIIGMIFTPPPSSKKPDGDEGSTLQ
jgi:hypothetical protein